MNDVSFVTKRFADLDRNEIRSLMPLTLSLERGDRCDADSADFGESTFAMFLREHLRGFTGYLDRWAIIGHLDNMSRGEPACWCMVERLRHDAVTHESCAAKEGAVGVYVSNRFRRRALGSLLIKEARKLADIEGWTRLTAFPWNRGSAAFFSSCGFRELVPYRADGYNGVARLNLT